MWTAIIEAVNKLLGIVDQVLGFIFARSDAKKKKKDTAQQQMDKAVKDDDPEAFLDGRSRKLGA